MDGVFVGMVTAGWSSWGTKPAVGCRGVSRYLRKVKTASGGCPYVVCQAAAGSFVAGWGVVEGAVADPLGSGACPVFCVSGLAALRV